MQILLLYPLHASGEAEIRQTGIFLAVIWPGLVSLQTLPYTQKKYDML